MIERIRALERVSRRLEPGGEERDALREPVLRYAETFLDDVDTLPAYEADTSTVERLRRFPLPEEGRPPETLLELFGEAVDRPGLNPASGGHLAYIPGGGVYTAALGDYLAAVTNRYAGIRFGGPGAVEMETLLIDWMAELVGYPDTAGGYLASGGSLANLAAVVAAREAHGVETERIPRAVVYLSPQTHHCVHKALRIAGLGRCRLRSLPLDDRHRIRPRALRRLVREDREAGFLPWLVVASAGTTDVGAVDPLEAIGRVAREEGLWYHVDAAYGGFFLLVDACRDLLGGIRLSDSVVMDPHKGLFLPYGLGALVVRDLEALHRAHWYRADYMQDARTGEPEDLLSPAELSPELTKHFRGPRMWFPLQLHGLAPFRACLEEKLWLARYFRREAARLGFEVGPEPDLSVVTYRWVPAEGDPDAFNRELVRRIHEDGRIFVSSTLLDGRFVLRLAVLSFRTHLDTIDLALEVLREKVAELERTGAATLG